MGTDNLHHKRKARSDRDLKRSRAKRAPYERVLIVCEGEKTEPLYFKELVTHYRLNTANVEICGNCDSSPKSVLSYAKAQQANAMKQGDGFDKVFCVFDKDCHESYQDTLNAIAQLKGVYQAIVSVPCFEYWLLLHFEYLTHPYSAIQNRSVCGLVIKDLKLHLPDYEKSQNGVFKVLLDKLPDAIKSAKSVLATSERIQSDNPSTKIHELIEYLQGLKNG